MITPGFFGFFNAQRGLVAAQNALSTINHNITNASTPGYSRQRVDLEAYFAYATPMPHAMTGGQIGQGPTVAQVIRTRDQFLDTQFRQSNSMLGNNTLMRDILQQVEGVFTEPSTGGINSALQNFFDAAQELSLHPESMAVRSDFVQQAIDLITISQQQAGQLLDIRRNLVGDPLVSTSIETSQLAITANEINSKLQAITQLNQSIVSIQASGAMPNDLLDQRDLLLDQLSKLTDIEVRYFDNGQIDLNIANQTMIRGGNLLNQLEVVANPGPAPTPQALPSLLRTTGTGVVLNDGVGDDIRSGQLAGIIAMGGTDPGLSTVQNVLNRLDNLLQTVVAQVNQLQQTGRDLDGNATPPDIFIADPTLNPGQPLDIFHWRVNTAVITNPRTIAAAADDAGAPGNFAGAGDGRNALSIATLRDQQFGALGTTFVDYFNGTVSKLGIDTRSFEHSSQAQNNLINAVDLRRQSISGVNIDEEVVDMLRFQRAFEAASRSIQTMDEIMQTIINMV